MSDNPWLEDGSIAWEKDLDDTHRMRLLAKDIRKERTGYHAEVTVLINGVRLAYDTFNIGKQDYRRSLTKTAHGYLRNGLEQVYPVDYMLRDVNEFCAEIKPLWESSPQRQGIPPVIVRATDAVCPPEYLVRPLIHRGQPTLMFADGGSCKSFLALVIAGTLATAWQGNCLRLSVGAIPVRPLYLDWETCEDEVRWRLKAIAAGTGMPEGDILYRGCTEPFGEDAERIERIVKGERIGIVITDSLGGAVGQDMRDNEAANIYFRAMRGMACASLTLTHVSKESRQEKRDATPFGSAYFWNWARNVFELKKSQEPGEDTVRVGIFHRKANNARLVQPWGYRFGFVNEGDLLRKLELTRFDIKGEPALAKSLPLSARISDALTRGALTLDQLTAQLEANKNSLKVELNRQEARGNVCKLGSGLWGLVEKDLEPVPF